jgi:type IV pilus assembly protein PilY1
MTSPAIRVTLAASALFVLLHGIAQDAHATDVATKPLRPDVLVKPNAIFAMDDSGSMDWDVLLNTNSGQVWWNGTSSFSGNAPITGGTTNTPYPYSYLFNITGTGGNSNAYNSVSGLLVPPTPQFAWTRSSSFNPLYYNPAVTYRPWAPAYVNGALRTYTNVSAVSAPSHPAVTGSVTVNLTANQTWTNLVLLQPGTRTQSNTNQGSSGWASFSNIYPATYWKLETCTPAANPAPYDATCVTAPDGSGRTLRKVEIKAANYATTAAYNADLQNFANWFTYYRKRKLMLAGSMGQVLEDLTGMRLGVAHFNARASSVTMYDTDGTDPASNARRVAGVFYTNPASGGTPTADTLNFVGNQYRTNNNIIQYSCQRNNAFVVTDGFANGTAPTPPAYDPAPTGSNVWPYSPTPAASLADIALSYYSSNLRNGRTTLTDGRVPSGDPTARNPDLNTNLHMNTYGLTLGVRGSVWPMAQGQDPWSNPFTWPAPVNDMPSSIDDLFHATINGRGQMYIATDPENTAQRVQDGLNEMLNSVGAQSAVAVSSVNLRRGDGKAYLGVYNPRGWTGDVTANAIDPSTGQVSVTPLWSAAERLLAKDWTTRVIATSVNGVGMPFTAGNVGSVLNPSDAYGATSDVVNYLRGDRSGETAVPATFRRRLSLMGAVLNARPAVSAADRVVYAVSSEGMVHAVDADNGEELWAYVPGSALSEMGKQTSRTWTFETYLDGSPQLFTVGTRKILVGGRGAAGTGYYALDVTNPRNVTSDVQLAARVLWEFPATQGVTTAGLAMGAPVLANTSAGQMLLLTQGYNGTTDGLGRLYMLNPLTGALQHTFSVNGGTAGIDPGLGQVTTLAEVDGTQRYAYAGDERGNLWRFDLQTRGTPLRLVTLQDASGNRQPITTAPTLLRYDGHTLIMVGTGRLLGLADFGSSAVQSFYVFKENGTTLANPRNTPASGGLVPRTLSAETSAGDRDLAGADVDWANQRGWYFDLPTGQQINSDPVALFGAAVFTTNQVTMTNCSSASYFYVVDLVTGRNVVTSDGSDTYASTRIGSFTVSGVTAMGYDGRGTHRQGFAFQRSTTGSACSDKVECEGSYVRNSPPMPDPKLKRKNSWRQVQRQ